MFNRLKVALPLRLVLAAGILCLIVVDYGLLQPFPIFFPKDYTIYREIADDSRDVVLLEVPLGVYSYAMFGTGERLIYYQPIHKKRIPSGALSRMSLAPLDYYRSFNLLSAIAGKTDLSPATAADELTRLVGEWNIGYVLVHRDLLTQEELRQLSPFFATHPSLCFWRAEDDLLAFRTRPQEGCPPIDGSIQVNLGTPDDAAHVGAGWHLPEDIGGVAGRWAGDATTATLRFDLKPETYCLSFRAWPYPPDQVLTLKANDTVIDTFPMLSAWATYTAVVPATAIRAGKQTQIQFSHATLLSPHERTAGESPDARALGAAYDWVRVERCAE